MLNQIQPFFNRAQNKPNLNDLPVGPALSAAAAQSGRDRNQFLVSCLTTGVQSSP
jgi:hypothetical protein